MAFGSTDHSQFMTYRRSVCGGLPLLSDRSCNVSTLLCMHTYIYITGCPLLGMLWIKEAFTSIWSNITVLQPLSPSSNPINENGNNPGGGE